MAFNAGQIIASLGLNTSNFIAGIKAAQTAAGTIARTMAQGFGMSTQNNINNTTRGINNLGSAAKKTANSLKDIERIVGGIIIAQGFYTLLQNIKEGTAALFQFSNNMEVAGIAMEYFLGNATRAKDFIRVMQDFAANTPFSTEQALEQSRRLMAMGFDPTSVKHVMTIMTDAAAATGATAEQMNRIILALGQMRTNGKIAGQELRQLAEAGIPVYKILQEELGLTQEQLREIGKLQISGDLGVGAVLKGLEKRYKGAGDRIADTTFGMIGTIKDDMLILGNDLFQPLFKGVNKTMRKVRDRLEQMRETLFKSGIGGVFESMFSKEQQAQIRSIIASFKSIGDSIGSIIKAFAPAGREIGGILLGAFQKVIVVIAGVMKAISGIVVAITQAAPWVRNLAVALAMLGIASTVAKALFLLWRVTGLGVICSAVAKSVSALNASLKVLFLTMSKNPWVALLTLAAGVLLYFGMTSKRVQAWMDQLTNSMAKMFGLAGQDIFKPFEQGDTTKDFDKQIDLINENLKNVGKNASKSAKAVKDKFVASFDELYQVPDALDDTENSLEDIGNIVGDIPAISIPSIPDFNYDDFAGGIDWSKFIPPVPPAKPPGGGSGGDKGGNKDPNQPPPPDLEPIKVWSFAIKEILENAARQLKEAGSAVKQWGEEVSAAFAAVLVPIALASAAFEASKAIMTGFTTAIKAFTNTVVDIATWVAETSAQFANWIAGGILLASLAVATFFTNFGKWLGESIVSVANWVSETAASFGRWVSSTASDFSSWVTNRVADIARWSSETSRAISEWVSSAVSDIGRWATDTGTSIATWVTNAISGIGNWASETGTSIATWVSTAISDIGNWATETGENIATWTTTAISNIGKWATDTGNNITEWVTTAAASIGNWVVNTGENIASWATAAMENIAAWATSAGKNVAEWVTNAATNIYNWAANTGKNIADWATSAMTNVANFASNASKNIADWVTNSATNVYNWATNVGGNIGGFARGAGTAIADWASNAWESMNGWIKGTASGVYEWAKGTLGTIVSWAQSAWTTISNLAKAAGAALGVYSGETKETVKEAYKGMSGWVSAHQKEITIAAAAAAVLGAGIATVATGGAAAPALAAAVVAAPVSIGAVSGVSGPKIKGYKRGGIITQEDFIMAGEGNKHEAIVPLQNAQFMRPFSEAVANDLMEMMGGGTNTLAPAVDNTRPIMYVGTLIADDRGLKELYRKMDVIRVAEEGRKGGGR